MRLVPKNEKIINYRLSNSDKNIPNYKLFISYNFMNIKLSNYVITNYRSKLYILV